MTVTLKYKEKLKESVVLFVHYLACYAEEIAKEKGENKISEKTIKEALEEIDLFEILEKTVEEQAK